MHIPAAGGGTIKPYPGAGRGQRRQAGLRNLAHNMHNTLGEHGIYVAMVSVDVGITTEPIEGYPSRTPTIFPAALAASHRATPGRDHRQRLIGADGLSAQRGWLASLWRRTIVNRQCFGWYGSG
jgi:hypothetical protein